MSDKNRQRIRRKFHIRKRISGTAAKPRLTVTRSNCNLYMQAIDDGTGTTLAAISTLEKDFKGLKPNTEGATKLGEAMGARLKDKSISTVVFDRNGYLYHGVVEALANGTRKAGIVF
jgi:large subunit ribosomal protein L18